jgi:predicted permease
VLGFLIAYGAVALLAFGFGFFRARAVRDEAPALQALGMSLSNSGYVGLPVALMVLGDGAVRSLAHAMIVENMVILPLALALCESQRRAGGGVAASLRAVASELVRNPILIGLAAGLAVGASGLALPDVGERTVRLLAGVAAPVALFAVGGMIAAVPVARPTHAVAWVVGGKLVLHPLLVLVAVEDGVLHAQPGRQACFYPCGSGQSARRAGRRSPPRRNAGRGGRAPRRAGIPRGPRRRSTSPRRWSGPQWVRPATASGR